MNTRNLFFYWTGKDYYLISLLREIILLHSEGNRRFNAVFLHDGNLSQYVDRFPKNFDMLNPAYKADYIRTYVVHKHGGIWVDADTLVMDNLEKLFQLLESGNGFFIIEDKVRICNGVFGSRANTTLLGSWLDYIYSIIENSSAIQWGELGYSFLTSQYKNNNNLFSGYQLFDGLETMYPVSWKQADNIYCSENFPVEKIKKDFQPLIILVNSVYKAYENNPHLLNSSVLGTLIRQSIQNFSPQTLRTFPMLIPLISKNPIPMENELSPDAIFTNIYVNNSWKGKASVSGRGSDPDQTAKIIIEIPKLLSKFNIETILDIPCGDFHWMKNISFNNHQYIGADIVKDLIDCNNSLYGNDSVSFQHLNLISDSLPVCDLLFCRDCLVHFSFLDTYTALQNIVTSRSKYLLTTTFITRTKNTDIKTGDWRPINLQEYPYCFPPPLALIEEGCTENNGIYKDKSLGLWAIDDIRKRLALTSKFIAYP